VATIDDIYYGLALMRSKMTYGCMLTSVSIAEAAVEGRLPGGPGLRLIDLGRDFDPAMDLVTGTFARHGERSAFDRSHPLNLLWQAFHPRGRLRRPIPAVEAAPLRLDDGIRRTVPAPDDPVGESAAFFRFGGPQLLQLLPTDADLLGEGIQNLEDVGEFLWIRVGFEELSYLLGQLAAQPCGVLIRVGRIDDRFQALGLDDLRDPVAD
jgi:hypothetical protein